MINYCIYREILVILHELFYNVYCKRFMSVTHA